MTAGLPADSVLPPLHYTKPQAAPSSNKAYIDAIRGWSILLVITCHVGEMFPDLPYPIKRLTNFGWHGVQMFFLASSVTLLMSWRRQQSIDRRVTSFLLRRFLRIAPMYYVGAIIYYAAEPPDSEFNLLQLVRSFTFVNAWSPEWIPTTPGWMVVPGGWSIGVEFTFYLVFPVVATLVTTLSRAAMLFVATVLIAVVCNSWGTVWFEGYGRIATANFLYFWFPNQAPVFALGVITYFLVTDSPARIRYKSTAYALLLGTVAMCVIVAERLHAPAVFGLQGVPIIFVATLGFMAFFIILSRSPDTVFTHPGIRRMGVLSFSAYVLHFLFVHGIPVWSAGLISVTATGYAAIGMAALLWFATVVCTFAAAAVANAWIEQPGIDLAHRLTASR